jgi:hypothetical protein
MGIWWLPPDLQSVLQRNFDACAATHYCYCFTCDKTDLPLLSIGVWPTHTYQQRLIRDNLMSPFQETRLSFQRTATFFRLQMWRRYNNWKAGYGKLQGSVVGWGTQAVAGSSPGWPNSSSCNMVMESSQPLTKMSTRNLPGGKKRPTRRADNLAAICVPNVWKCGSLNLSQP